MFKTLLSLMLALCALLSPLIAVAQGKDAEGYVKFYDAGRLNTDSLSPEDKVLFKRGYINGSRYVLGGVLAGAVGFGVGQAVTGHYRKSGWVFTVADTLALSMMIRGVMRETAEGIRDGEFENSNIYVAGAVLLVASRALGSVDAWVRPARHNKRYRKIYDQLKQEPANVKAAGASAQIYPYVDLRGRWSLGLAYQF
ncbi:MAG TPA: hypothetical protein VM901_04250 [Bdellovibrionota bacterium]|jgi:hypothetical protein|nr:hypothetical protein [Bdellovibrionota bacterium]